MHVQIRPQRGSTLGILGRLFPRCSFLLLIYITPYPKKIIMHLYIALAAVLG